MWFPVTLLLLVGAAVATLDHKHAWETESVYQYYVESRTLAGLELKEQYTGIQIKGLLNIQAKSPQTLWAKLSNPQYAHIHKTLLDGPESEISDQMLEYRPLPMSGKPFEIRLKHGVIRDLLVDRDVSTWELNILKSLVSQLQIDTQGENARERKSTQVSVDENSPVMFKAMEDSVGGNCEVLYDIMPLNDYLAEKSDRVPLPYLRGNGQHYEVKKIKNYKNCVQRRNYHHDLNYQGKQQGKIVSPLSTTYMIISGNLKSFAIQYSETKNQISVKTGKSSSPSLGTVYSITRLTLFKKSNGSNSKLEQLNNLESTGNLVYTYNNPFSDSENRRERQPSVSVNSAQQQSSESSSESSSGSSSSSSSSSEEYVSYFHMQSKAPLHMAPNVPLLPLFVGYKGKSIRMSSKFDVVESAQNLIYQIADEMQNVGQNTLEKHTILKNLLRIMNRKHYVELEDRVYSKYGKQSSEDKYGYNYVWNILRDAVIHAGTGPALYSIKNWLQKGKVEGVEAARIIAQLPKIVREPTPEYVNAFFEMIVDPHVSQQKYVNVSAPLSFGEMVRNSRIGQNLTYSSDATSQKYNNEVLQHYLSYLANQLKEGVHENDSQKVQTYALALGIIVHPKVIQILEPYIEGVTPTSKYQRFIMVVSLSTLARNYPKLVGPIFYKLYLDTREDHDIRCFAVEQLIMTDPSIITLQRIAKYTNVDKNEQVNSAVKTMIESVAKTKRPEWQNLAHKARSVRHLLNPTTDSSLYSRGYYKDLENWIVQGLTLQSIAGSDSQVPILVRFGVNTIFDIYKQPSVELGYSVSSIKQLLDEIRGVSWQRESEGSSEESYQKSHIEKLVQTLKIKSEKLDKLEGHVFANTPYGYLFYPFDSNTIKQAVQMMKNSIQKDHKVESTAFNNYETIMSFPTESGLPFVYTIELPTVLKLQVDLKKEETESSKRNGVLNAVVVNNILKRFGFLAPFEHQNYIVGSDEYRTLQIPIEFEVKLNINQRNLGLKIRPNVPQTQTGSQFTLLHYSNVPFTTRQDIFDLQPLSLNKNTHQILTSNVHKTTVRNGIFSIVAENTLPSSDDKETEEGNGLTGNLFAMFRVLQGPNNGHYRKVDLLMNTQEASKNEVSVNIVYDSMVVGTNSNDNESHETESQSFSTLNWPPNGESRRSQIMKVLSKGLQSGRVYVYDINYQGFSQKQHVLSIGLVKSHVDRKSKAYVYWNSQPQENEQNRYEVCYHGELQYSPSTVLDFEYALNNAPETILKSELYYGKSCEGGTKVDIVGSASRSNQLQEVLENSKVTKQCLKEIRQGNKVAQVCQKAIEGALVKNQYALSMNVSDVINDIFNEIVDAILSYISKTQVQVTNSGSSENSGTKSITLKVTMSPFDVVPNIHIHTPQVNVSYPSPMRNDMGTQRLPSEVEMLQNKVQKDSCTLDKDTVITFDKRTYPVTLGTIKHVLLTTYPQQNPNQHSITIPEDMRVGILAEDADDGSRIVTVLLGNQEVKLLKLNNRLQALVNGETVELSKQRSYVNRQDGKVVFEIVMLPDGSSKLISDKYGIGALYDGEHVQILASDKYHNAVRGLCGNDDFNGYNDFLTPNNCILTKAEEFAATYALIQENSQGPVVENRRKAQQAECKELSPEYQRNVISDGEAGRMTQSENWGYHQDNRKREHGDHVRDNKKYSQGLGSKPDYYQERRNIIYRTRVLEEGDELCFTTRPVPTCVEGTRPTERKSKKYDLYCQPRNEESLALKYSIEQSANPDLTRKPVTKSHVFQVSSTCSVA